MDDPVLLLVNSPSGLRQQNCGDLSKLRESMNDWKAKETIKTCWQGSKSRQRKLLAKDDTNMVKPVN
jgi:hypothetical protein